MPGVTWVLVLPVPEGKTYSQALEDFGRHLVNQGFEKDQPFSIKCETYASTPAMPSQKSFHTVLDSDRPGSCFWVSDRAPAELNITAEKSLMGFIGKLEKAYTAKKNSVMEVQGVSYLFHDFIIRAGILTAAGTPKGITVETELKSCPVAINAVELMREFVNSFMPNPMDTAPNYFTQRTALLTGMYAVMDTVLQYIEIFSHIRKTSAMPTKA